MWDHVIKHHYNIFCFRLQFLIIYQDDIEVCVKITTGKESKNDGTLMVKMNGEITARAYYDKGDTVVDTCFKRISLRDIQLGNPVLQSDAWAGHIEITRGGKVVPIKCDNCSGSQYMGSIVVGADPDSSDLYLSPTQCFGRFCSITWAMEGIFELHHPC